MNRCYEQYNYDKYTKNRKLIMVEYDDDGNKIDERDMGNEGLATLISALINDYNPLAVARAKYRNMFTDNELVFLRTFINKYNASYYAMEDRVLIQEVNEDNIELLRAVLDLPEAKRGFIVDRMNSRRNSYNPKMPDTYFELLDFVNNTDGVYYARDTYGNLCYEFNEKPTKKQAKYQRVKYGRTIVLYSFKTWQTYDVSEDELSN